jgi:hypothetical protein
MPLHQHGHDPAAAILVLFQVISIVIGAIAAAK